MNTITDEKNVLFGNDLSNYKIVVADKHTVAEYRMARLMRAYFKTAFNAELPVITDAEPAGKYEILVGKTNRGTVKVTEFQTVVAKKGDNLILNAGSLYGYRFLMEGFEKDVVPTFACKKPAGVLLKKDIQADLVKAGLFTRVVKPTDLRLITHNIWGWHNTNEANANHREVLREHMLAEVYTEYAPDILCMQECCEREGIGTSAAMRNADKNLHVFDVLPKNYVEIKNRCDGANYTATPIIYNKKALRLVTSGAKQFTGNGASFDKFYTWAIFKRGEKVFGMMSVHLDYHGGTRDGSPADGWTNRRAQIDTVAAKIKELSKKHGNCPFFVAGDMNTCALLEADVLQKWVDNGLTDTHDMATYSANTSSYAPDYPHFNEELDMIIHDRFDTRGYAVSIDHVYFFPGNEKPAAVRNYDILRDNYLMCGSDHAAVLVDFDL